MKRYSIAIALAAALLGGCNREQEVPTPPVVDATPIPLAINVGVGQMDSSQSRVGTRATEVVTGTAFADEARINVMLVDETPANATPEYPAQSQYVCAITGTAPDEVTAWSPIDPTKPPMVVINKAQVLAHYPAELPTGTTLSADRRTLTINMPAEIPYGALGELNFNAEQMTIPVIGSVMAFFVKNDQDYLVGNGGVVTAVPLPDKTLQNTSSINMKHALAMIVVQIKMDDTNPEKYGSITKLSIENLPTGAKPLMRGSVDIATNVFTPNSAQPIDYSRPMSNFQVSDNYSFGLLVYPATIAAEGDAVIKCVSGAAIYTYKIPASTSWKAGMVYLYTLTLKPASGVLSGSVQVTDWVTATGQTITME